VMNQEAEIIRKPGIQKKTGISKAGLIRKLSEVRRKAKLQQIIARRTGPSS